ncbi:hypothetical protein Micr_00272 [Candidatus Micrarchaeum sp.]|jgi:hypothetical protein|uniref:hypothetical protein n=1 Tax=Candidatus Micrarchaeum sp. TaxID=2282148 RepID=UPI000927756B|nr:hypothetical protein [Candidatus Micrarchaeum sp.]OJI08165.1 MAG: hypothetical protein BK997_01020 [Candidatus Micrarchaeum sp. ARMAN-1]OJT94274.1 MAG: hypothetical protein JJ59_02170 [Candidatus Micrarchaeum sp. AZ1]OWP53476.1 MAG: hypothetical protein B2I19_03455 [Thermoplasmatales archaeon ARMAN]QRF73755.1 hypothetical protein Micr_00272 [Candidatus Micrarchaeum sp.]
MDSEAEGGSTNFERLAKLNAIYLRIINRYRDYIGEEESLSVAELPRLVTPKDKSVLEKAEDIKSGFEKYSYERDFYAASVVAYEFVRKEIETINLPVEFWLEPAETMEFGAGEKLDRYTLLCSLIIALGNPSAKILIIEKNDRLNPILYYETDGIYLMDFDSEIRKFASKDEMLANIGIGEDSVAYEFNDKMYVDIT